MKSPFFFSSWSSFYSDIVRGHRASARLINGRQTRHATLRCSISRRQACAGDNPSACCASSSYACTTTSSMMLPIGQRLRHNIKANYLIGALIAATGASRHSRHRQIRVVSAARRRRDDHGNVLFVRLEIVFLWSTKQLNTIVLSLLSMLNSPRRTDCTPCSDTTDLRCAPIRDPVPHRVPRWPPRDCTHRPCVYNDSQLAMWRAGISDRVQPRSDDFPQAKSRLRSCWWDGVCCPPSA